MTNHEAFVGLDVHKETIAVAIAKGGAGGDVCGFGTIKNSKQAVAALARKLARRHGNLSFCYEAGPCGYAIYRQLADLGHDCQVVAPSLIPTKPGEHIKMTGQAVYRSIDDGNDVTVTHDFTNAEKAKAFASSPDLKAAMENAGVKGTPQIWLTTRAEQRKRQR
jgi:hypothetical protein